MPVGQCVQPPMRQTHQTTPHRMRSPRTRSPPAQSPDPVLLPASGPFDPGMIPSEGPPRPWNRPPQPVLARRRDGPPFLPPVTLQGIPERSAHFFCGSASFPAASSGIFSYCPKRPPPPFPGQSAPPGPCPIARRARQAAGGPGVAARSGGACCAAIASRTPGRGTQQAVPARPACGLPAC